MVIDDCKEKINLKYHERLDEIATVLELEKEYKVTRSANLSRYWSIIQEFKNSSNINKRLVVLNGSVSFINNYKSGQRDNLIIILGTCETKEGNKFVEKNEIFIYEKPVTTVFSFGGN